jgi:PAS domain S-box-containing protein
MRSDFKKQIPAFFGVVAASISALVLVGWFSHIPAIIQINSHLVPVQFNTALSLFAASLGLIFLQTKWKRMAALPGAVVFCIGTLTFAQYMLNVNVGIDELFMHFYLSTVPIHPGRMASDTALSFMLLGSAVLILSKRALPKNKKLPIYLATSVIVFGVLSLVSLSVTLPASYGRGNSSSMAFTTAVELLLIASGIIFTLKNESSQTTANWQDALPIFVTTGMLLVTFGVWQASLWNNVREIHQTTVGKGEAIRAQLLQGLDDRIKSIERMASRLAFTNSPSKEAWEADAEMYMQHLSVMDTFAVVNSDYRVKWVYPIKKNHLFLNYDLSRDAIRKQAIDNGRVTHEPQLTPMLNLKQGGRGFVLYLPLFFKDQFKGSLAASIRPEILLSHIVQTTGYEVKVRSDDEILYMNSHPDQTAASHLWAIQVPLDLRGNLWKMEITPTLDTLRAGESIIPYVILFAGVFGALILGMLAQLSVTARRQSQIIGDQKSFLDSVIESSPMAIVVMGTDHRLRMWNPACERVFGWKKEEVLGQHLPFVPEDSRVESHELIEAILNGGEKSNSGVETIRLTKSGGQVPVRIVGRALKDEYKRTYGLMAVIDDVTERKKAEQEIRDAREFAEKAALVKGQFLANMSHEIRTPLNGIIGMADLLLLTKMNEDQKRYAKIIQNSGSSLLTLINDILDFSKIEAGKMQLEALDFSLVALIETQADLLVSKARKKDLVLTTYISPNLPAIVRGDPGRLGQVILNLLGNAIKFTSSGSVTVSAVEKHKITNETGPTLVRFEVTDTGIGLSLESSSKLFLPFSQVDGSTARKFGGTGLGLSISKNIVEAMGGKIGIESAEGKGSTFWFEIDLNRIENPKALVIDRRVLIIDVDQASTQTTLRYLNAWRMHGKVAKDIADANSILQMAIDEGNPYHVLLLGKPPGPALQSFGDVGPKIILLTEFEDPLPASKSGSLPYASRITKPIKQSELYDSLVQLHIGHEPNSSDQKVVQDKALKKKALSGIRVLVADDVAANQLLTLKFLEFLGYQGQAVGNGVEALAILEHTHFDLILMDCQMPEMDGFETTRRIREHDDARLRNMPIIALTANAMGGDDKKCLEAGMDDYLSKPFKKERLDALISKWLMKKAG